MPEAEVELVVSVDEVSDDDDDMKALIAEVAAVTDRSAADKDVRSSATAVKLSLKTLSCSDSVVIGQRFYNNVEMCVYSAFVVLAGPHFAGIPNNLLHSFT